MSGLEYTINPVLMGGLVKETSEKTVKVHLHGRLGVITIPKEYVLENEEIVCGTEMQFYFSYLEVNETPYDYDTGAIKARMFEPCFIGGTICEVNDTAIKVDIMDNLGTVAVPRRWVFTSSLLENGQNVEFYFSPMKVVGKRDIPVESI
jgi:hypothetical protein